MRLSVHTTQRPFTLLSIRLRLYTYIYTPPNPPIRSARMRPPLRHGRRAPPPVPTLLCWRLLALLVAHVDEVEARQAWEPAPAEEEEGGEEEAEHGEQIQLMEVKVDEGEGVMVGRSGGWV